MSHLYKLIFVLPMVLFILCDSKNTLGAEESDTPASPSDQATIIIGNCQEIEYDLTATIAENEELLWQIEELSKSNKKLKTINSKLQNSKPDTLLSDVVIDLEEKIALTTNQLEQTSKKYAILIEEFEKRGEKIAELQSIAAKQDDKIRFLWFGAGAVVFFAGILAGKTGSRQNKKFTY